MTHQRWLRLALAYVAFSALQNGFWALLAPQSFYDGFPGFGRTWISVDGPFNEHLIRDFGALNLALASLFIYSAIKLTRPLVTAAAMAALVWGIPHLTYHVFNTDGLDAVDVAASLSGLALYVAFPVLILVTGRKHLVEQPTLEPR